MEKRINVGLLLMAVTITITVQQGTDFQKLTGLYLCQVPPANNPVLFAPGIISPEDFFEHSAAIFLPDG